MEKAIEQGEKIERIPLDNLIPSKGNRAVGKMSQAKLDELVASVAKVGVQEPAVVRPLGNAAGQVAAAVGLEIVSEGAYYEIVAGERRWRASRIAGLTWLPCIVREMDDATALLIRTVENHHREDPHPLDESDDFARLLELGHDVETIAQELGRSVPYIRQRLKLQDLCPSARAFLVEGEATAAHGVLIARLAFTQQQEIVRHLAEAVKYDREFPTVRELDNWIRGTILLELSGATWKLDDEDLVPEAGSCKACPKRTGSSPDLFEDIGKKDHCTDRDCFKSKGKAQVARRRLELEGEPLLEVVDNYYGHKDPEAKGALDYGSWRECKKKDEGAVRMLIVAGDHPGKLIWGKPIGSRAQAAVADPEEKARLKKARDQEKKLAAARVELRTRIYKGILEGAERQIEKGIMARNILRAVVLQQWNRAGTDTWRMIAKAEAWEAPKVKKAFGNWFSDEGPKRIASMELAELQRFQVVIAFAGDLQIANYSGHYFPRGLTSGAKAMGIDVKQTATEISKENKVPLKDLLPRDALDQNDEEDGGDEE